MKYRKFGSLDWQSSVLGFGCMRLPTKGDQKEIDKPEAIRMIRYAIDRGVNYLDTAYVYHGGQSEILVGKALKDGYRERVKLATKLPCWQVESAKDFDRMCNEQREKLQVDQIDLYLLHSLSKDSWKKVYDFGVLDWAEKAIDEGRIGCLGFSFHDEYEVFEKIVDAYDKFAFAQIQYNYLNEEVQAGTKGLNYAAEKGLAVVIMEPLLGGSLVNPPDAVRSLWKGAKRDRSPADWALQWLWNKPEVAVVLSGMSTMEQVEENINSAENSQIDLLTPEETELVDQVRYTYENLRPIPCTECNYCMPCSSGVEIPRNLMLYNNGYMYNEMDQQKEVYSKHFKEEIRASECTQCLECEDKCPQKIKISDWMVCIDGELGA